MDNNDDVKAIEAMGKHILGRPSDLFILAALLDTPPSQTFQNMVFFCTFTVFFSVPFYRDFVDLAWWQSKFITRLSREKIFNGSEFFQTSSYFVEMKKIIVPKYF